MPETFLILLSGGVLLAAAVPNPRQVSEFYASAIRRLMYLFNLDVNVGTEQCRATGGGQCLVSIHVRPAGVTG